MKKARTKFAAVMLVVVAMVGTLAGCGALSSDKIVGDWTTKTIGGTDLEAYAQSLGTTADMAASNMTFKDDGTVVCQNAQATSTMTYELKSNGLELYLEGSKDVYASVTYDDGAQTLTYSIQGADGKVIEMVMTKGKFDFTAAASNATDEAQ